MNPRTQVALILEDELELAELISLLLRSRFGARTQIARSAEEAVEYMSAGHDIGLVVADFLLEQGTAAEFIRAVHRERPQLPIILCTSSLLKECEGVDEKHLFGYINKPRIAEPLCEQVAKLMPPLPPTEKTSAEQAEYFPLSISTALKLSVVEVDLYVRIGEAKFVRAFNNGAVFEQPDYERYSLKKIDQLWLMAPDADKVIARMAQDIATLSQLKHVDTGKAFEVLATSHEAMRLLARIGFTPEISELTRASVDLAVKAISSSRELSDLLKKHAFEPERYITAHSIAVAYASAGLARAMGWAVEPTLQSLILAAFFHDITLDSHAMARANTRADLDALSFLLNEKEAREVLKHPDSGAKLLAGYSSCPPYATAIMEQHHEQPDGSGFPKRLNARQIHPMAALFNVAHDLVDYLNDSSLANVSSFVQLRRDKYLTGKYKAPFEQLMLLAAHEATAPTQSN